jgi:hypothetical protein
VRAAPQAVPAFRQPLALACLALLALAAILGSAAPAVAGECPNEAIRIEQHATHLPDCRAWEMVSRADKNDNQITQSDIVTAASGDRVLYGVYGGAPGSSTGHALFRAERTFAGWQSSNILPPRAEAFGSGYGIIATTPDLSGVVAMAYEGVGGGFEESASSSVVRLDGSGGQALLQTLSQPALAWGAAAEDLSRVLIVSSQPLVASHRPGTFNVYEVADGSPQLVSAMPGGDDAPACGIALGSTPGFATELTSVPEHWVSTDGRRAFFLSQGEHTEEEVEVEPGVFETIDNGCTGPLELYARSLSPGNTRRISGPPLAGDPDNGVDRFLQATPDGSAVFYRSATSLDPADDADGNSGDMDVYRYTAAQGNLCLSCALPNAEVFTGFILFRDAVVSEDGSHVYFDSPAQFDGAPSPGTIEAPNTYVWRAADDAVHFVAPTSGVTDRTADGGQVTPDGNALVFTSNNPALNALTGSDNGGTFQYYRYDDRNGDIACISCPAGRAALTDVRFSIADSIPAVRPHLRVITDDGNTVFFTTEEALLPTDENSTFDIYEWRDGVLGLITSGGTSTDLLPGDALPISIVTATPDGRDLFFIDYAKLTPDATDWASKLYDARVGGGFPAPVLEAPCQEEACRGALGFSPPPLAAATESPGPANLTTAHRRRHRHRGRHRHKRRHHQRGNSNRRASR